jgi:hypothetical protein
MNRGNNMRRFLFIISIFILISGSVIAGPLLLMDSYNARSFGLAGSMVAVKGGLDSIMVNPSGLTLIEGTSISIFYLPWVEDINFFSVSVGRPIKTADKYYGTMALNLSTFSIGTFMNYDQSGNRLADLSASDLLVNLGYGYPLTGNIDIGVNLKYVYTKLGDQKAAALAFDMSGLMSFSIPTLNSRHPDQTLYAGLALQNIGFSQRFIEDESLLPYKIRAGGSYLFYKEDKFDSTAVLEANFTKDQNMKLSGGVEAGILGFLKLRMGAVFIGDTVLGFSCGAGVGFKTGRYNFVFDYSLIPLQDFGTHHAFSLRAGF